MNNSDNLIKVFLADDHQLFLEGMQSMLAEEPDIEIVGTADNGQKVLDFLATGQAVDVILMDVEMPETNGIEATKVIKKQHPQVKILVLTMYNESEFILNLMKIGANGYILKNKNKNALVQAIHTVNRGTAHFDLEVLNELTRIKTPSSHNAAKSPAEAEISSREIEVLKLIAEGMTSKEISGKLNIAEATVNTHRRSLLHKLEVPNDKHLVRYAIRQKLIEP